MMRNMVKAVTLITTSTALNVALSLVGFVIFYSTLAVVDVFLMARTIRQGPDGLGHWPSPAAVALAPHDDALSHGGKAAAFSRRLWSKQPV